MKKLLDIVNLRISLFEGAKEVPLVDELNLSVEEGSATAIVGESGCGKSLTALAIMGLLPPNLRITSGSIILNGIDIVSISDEEHRRMRGGTAAMIFQEPMTSLNPLYSIGKQVAEVFRMHRGMSAREAARAAIEILSKVGITDPERRSRQYPHEFSGGMRQRAMIAMALAGAPRLIICDEPTTALDTTVQAQILELMKRLIREYADRAMLFITHDIGVVAETCDNMVVMYAGRDVESGGVREIIDSPLHPYTRGLLDSIPSRHRDRKTAHLPVIEGAVPRAGERPSGCAFRNRCAVALPACEQEIPIREIAAGGVRRVFRCVRESQ